MEQRLSLITLGVADLEGMKRFYVEKFGWKVEASGNDIVFFKLNGFLFSLFGINDLAASQGKSGSIGYRPYSLAYNVNSKEEVIRIHDDLRSKGVKIIDGPKAPPFEGYFFLFEDPEGNVWEVMWNSFIPIDDHGDVVMHKKID